MSTSSGVFEQVLRCCVLAGLCLVLWSPCAGAVALSEVPAAIVNRLDSGIPQDVIVLFDAPDVERESENMRRKAGLRHDDEAILSFKARRYRNLKEKAEAGFTRDEAETLSNYSQLPMELMRFRSRTALQSFLSRPEVKAAYENSPIYPHLAYSLPFINQPAAAGAGMSGSGTAVAVIDTGINYTLAAFGSCSAPGVPIGCRVIASVDVTGNNVTLNTDPQGHGTNVAGITAGVAPGARIAAVNAFSGGNSYSSWIIAGINWAIANRSAYNIVAINMSLGDGVNYTSPCGNSLSNPFVTPMNSAREAGIVPVASTGNSAFTSGISNPACIPGVVSVGAVYDASWGGPYSWGGSPPTCTDTAASAPNKIPCFSNSASFMTMLAPGSFITAAGIQKAGTSQASPHVAGAMAVLRAAYPSETPDQSIARITANGVPVTDPRNGITKPRLNLANSIAPPANDMFSNRAIASADAGSVTTANLNATEEAGEPNHAGNPGGKSVWWSWTPSSTGVASIDTHNSNYNTLLAVYTGTSPSNLAIIAANDNDGSPGSTSGVSFAAQAGIDYLIAVDGYNGATGQVNLNWSLEQQADLALAMTGPGSPVFTGESAAYDLLITNNGPSPATGVTITDSLPPGSVVDSIPDGCAEASGTVNCAFGTLQPGGTSAARIMLHFSMPGDYLNTAQISATTYDPASANNYRALSLTAVPAPAEPVPGLQLPLAGVAALALTFLAACGKRRNS